MGHRPKTRQHAPVGRLPFFLAKVEISGQLVEVVDAMADQIKIGMSMKGACDMLGVWQQNFWLALRRGADDIADGKVDTRYAAFHEKIARARGYSRSLSLRQITTAAQTDWRAAAWKLERCFPDEYGPKQETAQATQPQIVIQLPAWATKPGA